MPRRDGSTYIKVFNDLDKLLEMLNLALDGVKYTDLGRKYDVDHSSIIYQCQKYGVSNKVSLSKNLSKEDLGIKEKNDSPDSLEEKPLFKVPMPMDNKRVYNLEKLVVGEVNQGHNYKEYLRIEQLKRSGKVDKLLETYSKDKVLL